MTGRTELLERAPRTVLPRRGERVLCAVSGGLDSMCLLHMLTIWCREHGGEAVAAHFDHRLRGASSDRDAEFVREVCGRWGVPFTLDRGEVRELAEREGRSIEEAARVLRYAFLRRAAETEGCGRIFTAHHRDDNAETVLLALIRGTGLAGLAGMDWQRDGICRPLLDTSRAELEEYAARWGVPHVEDETNADPAAAGRNLLRLKVMPLLRELDPRAVEHICGAAGRVRTADRFLEEEARRRTAGAEVRAGRASLPAEALDMAPEAVRPRMLLCLLDRLGTGRRDVGAVHLEAVLEMVRRTEPGRERRVRLPHNVSARCGGRLILEVRPRPPAAARLVPGRTLRWGDYDLTLLDRPEGPGIALGGRSGSWTVAPPRPGDRLTLPGARGSRSVKRLCVDRGISPERRDRSPAFYADGRLAAVWPLGADAAFAPGSGALCRDEASCRDEAPCQFIQIIEQIKENES